MIAEDGSFTFIAEIGQIIERFLQEYQQRNGPFQSLLERSLVICYALGALRDDLEDLWKQFDASPVFAGVSPRSVYEQGHYLDREAPSRVEEIRQAIQCQPWRGDVA